MPSALGSSSLLLAYTHAPTDGHADDADELVVVDDLIVVGVQLALPVVHQLLDASRTGAPNGLIVYQPVEVPAVSKRVVATWCSAAAAAQEEVLSA
jgi:hypothetical protein